MALPQIDSSTFGTDVLDASTHQPVVAMFSATWCGPCRVLTPVLEEIAAEESDRMTIVKIDSDENPDLAAAYGVMSVPTTVVFRDREPVKAIVGAKPKRMVLADLSDVR